MENVHSTTKLRLNEPLPRDPDPAALPHGLDELLRSLVPGARVERVVRLGAERQATSSIVKATGYGAPLRISMVDANGAPLTMVFRTATPNEFGHDRRADRAAEMVLAFDTFDDLPTHVRAIDVGAIRRDGHLASLRDTDEFYLLTTYAPGRVYAERLREVAKSGATPSDVRDVTALARYLVELHKRPGSHPEAYRRAIRDLLGAGEGIFGIVDGYPDGTPGAGRSRLTAIERRCLEWRWRLKDRSDRLAKTHGDFHPFNIVFEGDSFTLLDASRGSEGDPADDVSCLAINFVFFALGDPSAWKNGLRTLWRTFWDTYLTESGDHELLDVIAPFLTWRALVLANPTWYAGLPAEHRDALLRLAERALAGRFDPDWAEDVFR